MGTDRCGAANDVVETYVIVEPQQRQQMRFPSRAVRNIHTSVAFFDKTVTSCDSCNCCSSCRNHSSQKCELCTECRTSKKPIGRLVNKHPHVRLTRRPTYYSVQLEARKRRLFHYLGSMVFCNK